MTLEHDDWNRTDWTCSLAEGLAIIDRMAKAGHLDSQDYWRRYSQIRHIAKREGVEARALGRWRKAQARGCLPSELDPLWRPTTRKERHAPLEVPAL